MNEYVLVVLHKLEDSFAFYHVREGSRMDTLSTRPFPHEVCLDPGRKKLFIAEMGVRGIESGGPGGHTVAVYDLRTRRTLGAIDTGPFDRPHGIATFGGNLFVTSESTRHLLVYDLSGASLVTAIPLGQECAHMVAVQPGGGRVYTANIGSDSVTAVETGSWKVLRHIPVPERPEGMVFSADGAMQYCVCREAGCVAVVDCRRLEMVDTIATGDGPVRVAITPGGRYLGIPLFHAAAVQVVDTRSRGILATIPVGPRPAGTCLSPDGKFLFISCEEENRVYVIGMESLEVKQTIETGKGADAMVCLLAEETE